MTAYNYIALNGKGKRTKGVIESDTARQARQQLRDRGLMPLEVEPSSPDFLHHTQPSSQHHRTSSSSHYRHTLSSGHHHGTSPSGLTRGSRNNKSKIPLSNRVMIRRRLSATDLALITRQMAALLVAGIPIDEMLSAVAEQAEKPKMKRILLGLRAKVLEGYPLADSMKAFPSAFSKLYRTTVAAGEQSGQLGPVLEKLAEFTERQCYVRQKVRQALVYPSIMLSVSISIVIFLLVNVVPKIIGVFTETHQTLPLATTILIHLSQIMRTDGLWILLGLILCVFGFYRALKKSSFRKKTDRFLLKIPIIGKAIRTVNCARFGRTLGILTASSVPVLDAMQAVSQLITSIPMCDAVTLSIDHVREGSRIHQALKRTAYFPPMFIHLVSSGESSSQLETMLEKAASYLENDMEALINNTLTLFEPCMILVMGGIVLFIVLAIMLPIFSLDQIGAQL